MNKFISISTRILGIAFLGMAALQTTAHSGSMDERFKSALNREIVKIKVMDNAADKRENLGNFLKRMDGGLEMAKTVVSEKDGQALGELQQKLAADKAQLAKVADKDLNGFANYIQQDVEQADQVIFISAGGLIIILIILLILL